MARRAAGLTAQEVKTAKPGRYGDGSGLYLLVRPTKPRDGQSQPDARFWVFRYTPKGGKMREKGLGPAGYGRGEIPLADARIEATELIKRVRAGVDPLAQVVIEAKAAAAAAQEAKIKATTFKEAAEKFMDGHEAALSNAKHKTQWRNTMATYVYPIMGEIPIGDVDTPHVLAVLEPIWTKKPETAVRIRGRIEAVLDSAKVRKLRSGDNPAVWRGHLSNALPKRSKFAPIEHHAALPWPEISDFYKALAGHPGIGAMALRFTILTGARSGETLGATWGEVDLDKNVWSIPGVRMKAKKEHRVPLSNAALDVLKAAKAVRQKSGVDQPIFPGAYPGRGLSDMGMAMVLRRMNRDDLTVHGFRSTFRDWAAERTGYQSEVVEMALAHTVENKVEAAYRRGDLFDKRAQLMAEWAAFCTTPAPATGYNVSPMRAAPAA